MLDDLQEGIKRAYPTLKHVAGTRGFINRNFKDEIVPLISGGGSGHDPAHWGFVGDGMLAGAVSGELFVPPTAKEIIEVEAGDGAVIVQVTGELKIKSVKIDPAMVDLDDIAELEHWIQIAVRDGLAKAQEIAAEKMKPLMGGLGNLGL